MEWNGILYYSIHNSGEKWRSDLITFKNSNYGKSGNEVKLKVLVGRDGIWY